MADISAQGLLTGSGTSTNVAIDGNGFFPVRDSLAGGDIYYTRNGEFSVDSDGYLTNGGFYLLGWRTDADGNITGRALEPIDVDAIASTASATTEVAIKANLPADAAASTTATFNTTMELYDLLGAAHSMEITWTKTARTRGRRVSPIPLLPAISTGSGDRGRRSDHHHLQSRRHAREHEHDPSHDPSHDHGQQLVDRRSGQHNHPRSRSSGDCDRAEPVRVGPGHSDVDLDLLSQDGIPYGKLRSVAIDDEGTVIGSYSNGEQIALFKISVATFTNPNGLSAMSGGIYAETSESGSTVLHESGEGGAGDIEGGTLEASTTDTSEEFTKIVAAQQAYSSAAQIITTVDKMFETLIASVR